MSDLVNITNLSFLLAFLGVAFGLFQILKREGGRLAFEWSGQRLIEDRGGLLPDSVEVFYNKTPVSKLILTEIVIWNVGRGVIRGSDVVPNDPFRFYLGDDAQILQMNVMKTTRASNGCGLGMEHRYPGAVCFDFEFLEHGDGAAVSILHTGDHIKPAAMGTIIGLSGPIKDGGRSAFPFHVRRRWLSYLLLAMAVFIAAVGAEQIWEALSPETAPFALEKDPKLGPSLLMIGLACFFFFGYSTVRRRFPISLAFDRVSERGGEDRPASAAKG